MNIGISTTVTAQSGDLTEVARQAEALGYDSSWIPEHPVVPVHRTTPFPASRDGQITSNAIVTPEPAGSLCIHNKLDKMTPTARRCKPSNA